MRKKFSQKRGHPKRRLLSSGDLIGPKTLASKIDWHEESVRRALRQGRIKGIKLGRGWRISRGVLAEIMVNGIPPRGA
jgi:hypothetical protein